MMRSVAALIVGLLLWASPVRAEQISVAPGGFAGVAPLIVVSAPVDFNAIADYPLLIPASISRFGIQAFRVINTGTTASLTTAQYGVFTQQAGAGVAVIATGTALSAITSNAANTNANQVQPGVTVNAWWDRTTLTNGSFHFRVTQQQGAAASGVVYLIIIPYL